MATALVCLDSEGERLIGFWLPRPDGSLDTAFRGTVRELQIARAVAETCPPDVTWGDYCQQLAQRTPTELWWESREVDDGTTADALLRAEVIKQIST